jgi:hypothetical protein
LCKQNARKTNQCFLRLEGGFRVEVWLNRCLAKIMGALFVSGLKFWFCFLCGCGVFGGATRLFVGWVLIGPAGKTSFLYSHIGYFVFSLILSCPNLG